MIPTSFKELLFINPKSICLDPILHYTNRATLAYKRISSAITPLMSLQSGAINLSLLEKDLLRLSSSRKKEITFHWITILVPLVSHFSSWQFIWAENEANEKEWKSNQISNGQLHYYEVQGLAIRSFDIAAIPKMNVPFQLPYNREQKHVLQFRKSDFFVV